MSNTIPAQRPLPAVSFHRPMPIRRGLEPTPEGMARMTKLADTLGGQSTFVIREDLLTDEAIATLGPHGSVSIWNDPGRKAGGSIAQRTEQLRERGVDGVIDLR